MACSTPSASLVPILILALAGPLHAWQSPELRMRELRGTVAIEDGVATTALTLCVHNGGPQMDEALWALPVLRELGFTYDASGHLVLNPSYGIPGAPRLPHRTAEGLLEIPCPPSGSRT